MFTFDDPICYGPICYIDSLAMVTMVCWNQFYLQQKTPNSGYDSQTSILGCQIFELFQMLLFWGLSTSSLDVGAGDVFPQLSWWLKTHGFFCIPTGRDCKNYNTCSNFRRYSQIFTCHGCYPGSSRASQWLSLLDGAQLCERWFIKPMNIHELVR